MDGEVAAGNAGDSGLGASSNVREFFRRPDTEDTLSFLKRQHMEQMQRMEELERDIVSPLKAYRPPGSPAALRKQPEMDSASSLKNAGSPLRQQHRASSDVLLQQLRGEAPLPGAAAAAAPRRPYLYPHHSEQASPLRYRSGSRGATMAPAGLHNNRKENGSRNDPSELLQYIRALAEETDRLRELVYRQQQDINALNGALRDERARNDRTEARCTLLEDRVRFREIAAMEERQQQQQQQPRLASFQGQGAPQQQQQRQYQQPMNIHRDDGAYMRRTPAPPPQPQMPTTMPSYAGSNGIDRPIPDHLNSAATEDLLRGYGKSYSQEFISSPTNARNMPKVDDMTANLLLSSRGAI